MDNNNIVRLLQGDLRVYSEIQNNKRKTDFHTKFGINFYEEQDKFC